MANNTLVFLKSSKGSIAGKRQTWSRKGYDYDLVYVEVMYNELLLLGNSWML
jgi:hypothetical protein